MDIQTYPRSVALSVLIIICGAGFQWTKSIEKLWNQEEDLFMQNPHLGMHISLAPAPHGIMVSGIM